MIIALYMAHGMGEAQRMRRCRCRCSQGIDFGPRFVGWCSRNSVQPIGLCLPAPDFLCDVITELLQRPFLVLFSCAAKDLWRHRQVATSIDVQFQQTFSLRSGPVSVRSISRSSRHVSHKVGLIFVGAGKFLGNCCSKVAAIRLEVLPLVLPELGFVSVNHFHIHVRRICAIDNALSKNRLGNRNSCRILRGREIK